jgi:hypothetical protein
VPDNEGSIACAATTDAEVDDCGIEGAVGAAGGGCATLDVDGDVIGGCTDEDADGDATAAAAAAAYRIGGNVGGFDVGRPDLTTLDMGACEKFGFGGGFARRNQAWEWNG